MGRVHDFFPDLELMQHLRHAAKPLLGGPSSVPEFKLEATQKAASISHLEI
jgi:hypothetical protein